MVAGDLSTQRFNRDEYLSPIAAGGPARVDESGRQQAVIPGRDQLTKTLPRTPPVISTEAKRSGEISRRSEEAPWRQEISRLSVSIEMSIYHP